MIIESPLNSSSGTSFTVFRLLPDHDLFLKLEGFNVTGSIKMKTAIALLRTWKSEALPAGRNRICRIVIRQSGTGA